MWHSVMSQSIKGETADKAFQVQCFSGREELLLVWTLAFLIFKTFYILHAQENI